MRRFAANRYEDHEEEPTVSGAANRNSNGRRRRSLEAAEDRRKRGSRDTRDSGNGGGFLCGPETENQALPNARYGKTMDRNIFQVQSLGESKTQTCEHYRPHQRHRRQPRHTHDHTDGTGTHTIFHHAKMKFPKCGGEKLNTFSSPVP